MFHRVLNISLHNYQKIILQWKPCSFCLLFHSIFVLYICYQFYAGLLLERDLNDKLLPNQISISSGIHCMKSMQIRSFFYFVFSPNAGKYGPEKTPYSDNFHAVINHAFYCEKYSEFRP